MNIHPVVIIIFGAICFLIGGWLVEVYDDCEKIKKEEKEKPGDSGMKVYIDMIKKNLDESNKGD
jgi:hypothetical protein